MSVKIGVNPKDERFYIENRKYFANKEAFIHARIRQDSDAKSTSFEFTGSIVSFVISTPGKYKLEAWGATGGSSSATTGPKGAYSRSYVFLEENEEIKILVGETGGPGWDGGVSDIYCAGGGGGTFIAKGEEPLCVAGGGGSFTLEAYDSVQSHGCGQSTQLGGTPNGSIQGELRMGGKASSAGSNDSGGGGGFEGNGEDGTYSGCGKGGISFLNGGSRQPGTFPDESVGYGGFGGGGSRHGTCGESAGGGGYSGGSATPNSYGWTVQGGGGGSYYEGKFNNEPSFAISGCDTSLPTNPDSNGNGYAIITLLKSTKDPDLVHLQLPCSNYKGRFLWTLYSTLSPYRL